MLSSLSTWMSQMTTLAALMVLAMSGCQLIGETLAPESTAFKLPPLVDPRDQVEMEVYFIDRHVGDPMIGDKLWRSLFSVTSLSSEIRQNLEQDGFRFAMGPARPPRELGALMRKSSENDPGNRVQMQRYQLYVGQEAELVSSAIPDATVLNRTNADDSVTTVELNQGAGLFRVRAERVEEGWLNLVIIPEIRHGNVAMRPQATDQEWIYHQGQSSIPFYKNRMSALLNVGEMLVLGLDTSNSSKPLASHFFRSDETQSLERIILIRVTDMKKVHAVSQAAK